MVKIITEKILFQWNVMETAPVSIEVCKESLFVCLFMQMLWQKHLQQTSRKKKT